MTKGFDWKKGNLSLSSYKYAPFPNLSEMQTKKLHW